MVHITLKMTGAANSARVRTTSTGKKSVGGVSGGVTPIRSQNIQHQGDEREM